MTQAVVEAAQGTVSAQDFERAGNMGDVLRLLPALNAGPGWNKPEPSLWPSPRINFLPAHWSYVLARAALDSAGRYISTEKAERRNLILANPVPGNDYATVRTLVSAYQMVKAGEKALSHRHTPNALRLIVEAGQNTYTIVDGKKIPMEPGDIVLTPSWHWHGHSNESAQDAYWIDFLDVPTVQFLEPMFLEYHKQWTQEAESVHVQSTLRFPAAETAARAKAAAAADGGFGRVELDTPQLSSMKLAVWHLTPGLVRELPRTTANAIFAVVAGGGTARVDSTDIQWRAGDVFTVPSWRPLELRATTESRLFRVGDDPLMSAMRWLRTEELPQSQKAMQS